MNSISALFDSCNNFISNATLHKYNKQNKINENEQNEEENNIIINKINEDENEQNEDEDEDDYYHIESNNKKTNIDNEDYLPEIYRSLDVETDNEKIISNENDYKKIEKYDFGITNLDVEFSEIKLKNEKFLNSSVVKLALMSSLTASLLIYGIIKKK